MDFSIGDNSGYLRFEDSKAAEKARMSAVLADGGLIIKDHIITLEPVTGKSSSCSLLTLTFCILNLICSVVSNCSSRHLGTIARREQF